MPTLPLFIALPPARSYLQRRRDRQGAYFTYEVIVVDDGSKDGTVRWVPGAALSAMPAQASAARLCVQGRPLSLRLRAEPAVQGRLERFLR